MPTFGLRPISVRPEQQGPERSVDVEAGTAPLSALLWHRTKTLHVQAERSGIIARMLRGTASRGGYALLMFNLVPVYRALEAGLARHAGGAGVGLLALPEVYRVASLEADLRALGEAGLRVLPEALAYAALVEAAAEGRGERLIAHAYARTLGDLSGGQILARLLGETLGLGADALGFYAFPAIADIAAFKARYRGLIDAAAVADVGGVLDEAEAVFRVTIVLSEAVAAASVDIPARVSEH